MPLVLIIIAAAVVYILFAIYRRITHHSGCDSHCDNCPLHDCKNRDRTKDRT
ncbi:MAG: FeoB-associated Cys-rich membrane protein [Bacteroidales bacterium]|nr:FeoB-associated Cys-rich membrane protein [Bacteroidales bacterium]